MGFKTCGSLYNSNSSSSIKINDPTKNNREGFARELNKLRLKKSTQNPKEKKNIKIK